MDVRKLAPAVLVLALPVTMAVAGQHEGHQAGTPPQPAAAAQCAQAQRSIAMTLDAAGSRLEAARQTNSPAAMRAAIDDLQAALRDVRLRLGPCAAMGAGAATDPHAGQPAPAPNERR